MIRRHYFLLMMRRAFPSLLRQAPLARCPAASQASRPYGTRAVWLDLMRGGPWSLLHRHPHPWLRHHLRDTSRLMDWLRSEVSGPAVWGMYARSPVTEAHRVHVEYNEKTFQITVDVSDYSPEDISVKVVDDKITLIAKQQETADEHGFSSRQMARRFLIPEDVDPDSIQCHLTAENNLVINGKVDGSENVKEREVKIERKEQENASSDDK